MKNSIVFFVLVLLHLAAAAQLPAGVSGKTIIYFVRHAEKENGNDPVLTPDGNKRAGSLAQSLKDKNIRRIYVTQFRRTQMTADSMRLLLGIDTVHYQADNDGADLFKKIAAHHDFNGAILVIGHSNTIPHYIKNAGVNNYPQANIPDNEFGLLFKVNYRRPFLFSRYKAHVKINRYGAASAASATMQKL